MLRAARPKPKITMTLVDATPESRALREQADRNWKWLWDHIAELRQKYRGQCVVIAGQEAFASESGAEAMRLAEAAHPEDKGKVIHSIPRERSVWIYAHRR